MQEKDSSLRTSMEAKSHQGVAINLSQVKIEKSVLDKEGERALRGDYVTEAKLDQQKIEVF